MHLRSALSLLLERRISYRSADRRDVVRSDGILGAECGCYPRQRGDKTLQPHLVILAELLSFFRHCRAPRAEYGTAWFNQFLRLKQPCKSADVVRRNLIPHTQMRLGQIVLACLSWRPLRAATADHPPSPSVTNVAGQWTYTRVLTAAPRDDRGRRYSDQTEAGSRLISSVAT